jgi:hypothetical protein
LAALGILALGSCDRSGKPVATRSYSYVDSAALTDLTFELELPESTQGTVGEIRKGLIDIMDSRLAFIGSYEGERLFPRYDGNLTDTDALIDYYRSNALKSLSANATSDFEERAKYIMEDPDYTDEERADILNSYPGYEYDFSLTKEYETPRYVVFSSIDYIYLGGAHGGVTGEGSVTFDKRNGLQFTEFFKEDALEPMQPLLLKGLTEYFSDNDGTVTEDNVREFLFLDSDTIPFPVWIPAPTADGLCLTYQQYEIAAYAMGMPSFILPYEDVKPYLTPEAIDLLKLK